ncbi:MAG TPA: membrane protein insertase YidC [Planctomycetota bacterium]|nr:membrane protein insertase YidC [Planctomycetota bacterium]
MEKRVVLLVVLCVLVFVGWSLLMQWIYPPKPRAPALPTPAADAKRDPPPSQPPPDPAKPTPGPEVRQTDEPEKTFVLENEKIGALLTNKGAGIREASVKAPDMPLLLPFGGGAPHLAVSVDSETETARWGWSVKDSETVANRSITYVFKLRNGVDLEKRLSLEPGKNEIDMLMTVRHSRPGSPTVVKLRLAALTGLEHDSSYRYDYYGHGFVTTVNAGSRATQSVAYDAPQPRPRMENDPNPPRVLTVEVPPEERAARQVEWFGLRNRYATAVLLAREDMSWVQRVEFRATEQISPESRAEMEEEEKKPPEQRKKIVPKMLKALSVEADLREARVDDRPHIARFSLVLSPVRREDLASIPGGADHLLSYGCWGLFNPIGRLILWLVDAAYGVARNYGWAIILTTLVVRLCLFPLTRKSQVSMARMAELQPKLNLLRERYPDDPAKQQQETMKLFKENGVNPLSGCFPIMMQLPVFIGLYSVLDISLEFRKAPFLAWIHDLSQPDRLIQFKQPFDLLVTSVSEFNLVPIVMTVTWFLQSYFAPRPQDPKLAAQQKMMMFMPVVFGLLCYSLASGLSLYLFVNSLLAMIEQKVIKKFFLPAKAALTGPPVKGAGA